MRTESNKSLSELENKVMDVIWSHGTATADTVRLDLQPWRSLKDSTIRTVLRRLAEKGYVQHVTEGRTYVYSPTQAAPDVAADAVRGLVDKLCNGSIEALLLGMVDREVVSAKKLEQLAKRIASSKAADAKQNPQRKKES